MFASLKRGFDYLCFPWCYSIVTESLSFPICFPAFKWQAPFLFMHINPSPQDRDSSFPSELSGEAARTPTVTIVTAVYNRSDTIANAIESVISQTSDSIEYIVVDGMSSDGTADVVEQYRDSISRVIREPDDGLYDALNKGIEAASGDVVGFVHADDMLEAPDIIEAIQNKFSEGDLDAVYGDLLYVDASDPQKIVRNWRSGEYRREKFRRGWMPPHPTLFVRKLSYQQFGGYRTDLGSGADYECLIRLLYKHKLRAGYVKRVVSRMRVGGQSNVTLENRLKANRSDRQAWIENGYRPPIGLRLIKPLSKLPQYLMRSGKLADLATG